ncbi:serine hydrolase [Robiginitalea sp. M366]|uniref:serine hydrolase domain-containing protein n=1 Tax=Robiginitalea aestuariiviva TaxID=3036903 RepID=UPI00240E2C69|nr:serine hydrolase domain-containing protein [Robiginitalea aestuariiviva]MDG1570907.1 serine hydrolase [Robiginitalea aestuariiviva]
MMKGFWERILPFFGVAAGPREAPLPGPAPEVDAMLAALPPGGHVPGLAIGVCRGNRPPVFKGYGLANLEEGLPVDPEHTVFRIASVSKPITATALARLVGQGILSLDDPLARYVPEYPQTGITLRHLAAHTAGLRAYRGKEYALNRPMSIAQGLEVFRDDPLEFEPGTGFNYNSFDFVLLSLAMERAAGLPFERLVEQEVLRPLGMEHTTPEDPVYPVAGQAGFYTRSRAGFRRALEVDNRYKLAGGGYLSTVADLCRLGKAYLQGAAIPEDLKADFLQSQEVGGNPTWYGLGWQVSRDAAGRAYYGHVGNGVGGYSNFYVYPEYQTAIGILVNCTDPGIQAYLDMVIDRILEDPDGA